MDTEKSDMAMLILSRELSLQSSSIMFEVPLHLYKQLTYT